MADSEILKYRDPNIWKSYNTNFGSYQFHHGKTLENLNKFRMPSGPRSKQWLEADRAVSVHKASRTKNSPMMLKNEDLARVWSLAREEYKKIYERLSFDEPEIRDDSDAFVA